MKKVNGIIVHVSGKTENFEIDMKEDETGLHALQKAVSGFIQGVQLRVNVTMYVNEEGKLENLPHNQMATLLWQHFSGVTQDTICGAAVIMASDEEGALVDMHPATRSEFERVINTLRAFIADE